LFAMTDAPSNIHEYTVSELSGALKRTVEEAYGHVRVRGELGRVTVAKSGHVYLDMKDERAVIDGVMWKGLAANLSFRPEEGLEVIAEGKLSTFPGRSKYQLIIDRLEPAGEGALMALLEARKKALAAEGLFAQECKRALPFLPRVIGVVTSPTGAVIRDILHRLEDRFPVHVLLWPVRVQGEGAAAEIAAGIEGLNRLAERTDLPTPDLLIVARVAARSKISGRLTRKWWFAPPRPRTSR
jgi:exodeoxyribonuclease VII large subunit